jgi:low affinity Fe/Cu permease
MSPSDKQKQKMPLLPAPTPLERSADAATKWLGSTSSLIFHTCLFILAFILPFIGVRLDLVLLVLTTAVSLEAIYMNIFIQMAVNKNTADIEDIAEDVDEIQEDIDEIQEDVDEIQKDVDEIQEDIEEDQEATKEEKEFQALASIQSILTKLQHEIEQMKKK